MMAFMKQLEKTLRLAENEKRIRKKTNEELMKKYASQNTVVQKSVRETVKKRSYSSFWHRDGINRSALKRYGAKYLT